MRPQEEPQLPQHQNIYNVLSTKKIKVNRFRRNSVEVIKTPST